MTPYDPGSFAFLEPLLCFFGVCPLFFFFSLFGDDLAGGSPGGALRPVGVEVPVSDRMWVERGMLAAETSGLDRESEETRLTVSSACNPNIAGSTGEWLRISSGVETSGLTKTIHNCTYPTLTTQIEKTLQVSTELLQMPFRV